MESEFQVFFQSITLFIHLRFRQKYLFKEQVDTVKNYEGKIPFFYV